MDYFLETDDTSVRKNTVITNCRNINQLIWMSKLCEQNKHVCLSGAFNQSKHAFDKQLSKYDQLQICGQSDWSFHRGLFADRPLSPALPFNGEITIYL